MMKRLAFLLFIVYFVFSCTSKEEITLLGNLSKSLDKEANGMFRSINIMNQHDYQIEPSLYTKFQMLDSAYRKNRELVLDASFEDILQLSLDYRAFATGLVGTDYKPVYEYNTIPKKNSALFAQVELSMLTNEIINHLSTKIGSNDIKFDGLRAMLEISSKKIKYGEQVSGKVYLAATTSSTNDRVIFLLNGDTLETEKYYADFKFTPKKRGIHKLKFEIKSNMKTWMSNIGISNQEIELIVE